MALRPLLLAAVVGIAALGAFHTPAVQAQSYFSVSIGNAPPPRYERVIYRPGYHWVPGRWMSNGRRYFWQQGHHVRLQSGYGYGHNSGYYAPQAYSRPVQVYRTRPGYLQRPGYSRPGYYQRGHGYRNGSQWRQPQSRARVRYRVGW